MKTNIKLEIGLVLFSALLGIILQTQIKSQFQSNPMIVAEITGKFETRTIEIDPFEELDIHMDLPVQYLFGEPKVEIKTDKSFFDLIKTESKNNKLKLSTIGYFPANSNLIRKESMISIYNNKEINKIFTDGNTSFDVLDTLVGDEIRINCNGNSSSRILANSKKCFINTRGNSNVAMTGKTSDLEVNSNGNSRYYLKDFDTQDAVVKSNGNSGGEIKANISINGNANGNANIRLYGSPTQQRTNASGNARIKNIDND